MVDHDDRNERKAPSKKHSLFAELEQAMGDVKAHREGRLTLRAHGTAAARPGPEMNQLAGRLITARPLIQSTH